MPSDATGPMIVIGALQAAALGPAAVASGLEAVNASAHRCCPFRTFRKVQMREAA